MKKRVLVNGEVVEPGEREVSIELVEPGVWSVLVDGRSLEIHLDGDRAWIDGRGYEVSVEDPRELTAESASAMGHGRRVLKAPMPGRVVRVLIGEGAEVPAGQGILVVEAMKMQNEMASPKAGKVVAIHVRAGDAVAAGQILAEIE